MRLEDYQNATLRTLFNAIEAHYDIENARIRESWEQTRWQTCALINIQIAKKDRVDVYKLLPLPWDEDNPQKAPVKRLTAEELKEMFAKGEESLKQRKALLNGHRGS